MLNSSDTAIAELEREVAAAIEEGSHADVIDRALTLAEIVTQRRLGCSAAALFPFIITSCSGDQRAGLLTDELKHTIMRYDPSNHDEMVTDHPTVGSNNVAYVAVRLLQGGVLSTGEYILLLERLSQLMASPEDDRVISVLHLLRERNPSLVEKALVFMAGDSGMSLMPLSRCWPQAEAFRRLPVDYATTRGAFAFDQIEDALLVAMLNPYDTTLQNEVQWQEEQKCLFYLVAPDDYDGALKLLFEVTRT